MGRSDSGRVDDELSNTAVQLGDWKWAFPARCYFSVPPESRTVDRMASNRSTMMELGHEGWTFGGLTGSWMPWIVRRGMCFGFRGSLRGECRAVDVYL